MNNNEYNARIDLYKTILSIAVLITAAVLTVYTGNLACLHILWLFIVIL